MIDDDANPTEMTRVVKVQNEQGLHLRPADLIVKKASEFASKIRLECKGQIVDAISILSIATLGAGFGTEITVRAIGPDATQALDELEALFESKFNESSTATDSSVAGDSVHG